MKYTKKQNNRRYKLHYKCRQRGVGIDVKSKTCEVVSSSDINKYVRMLVAEYNYVVQKAIYIKDKRIKSKV